VPEKNLDLVVVLFIDAPFVLLEIITGQLDASITLAV